jgi:hypothetical protein
MVTNEEGVLMTYCNRQGHAHRVAMKLITGLVALGIAGLSTVGLLASTATSAGAATTPPVLPNPVLTPGQADPRVSQTTIHSTICRAGYTASVRPPYSVTEPEKRASLRQYGLANYPIYDFEFDHDLPLELGGGSSTLNLWPQGYEHSGLVPKGMGSETKDRLENFLNHRVCSGRETLAAAQSEMLTNWIAAARRYHLTK